MNGGSPNDPTVNPSLSNMLHMSVFIHSNTIIGQDRRVQSYYGVKLVDIPPDGTGWKPLSLLQLAMEEVILE
ncbi:hypothetical protein Tco_0789027 [Tanacetum coccineum]